MQNSFIALSAETGYLNIMFDAADQLPPETREISEATLREAVSTASGGDQPRDLINILKRFNVTGRPVLPENTSQLLLSHAVDHFQELTGMQVIRQTATPETTSQGQPLQMASGQSQ